MSAKSLFNYSTTTPPPVSLPFIPHLLLTSFADTPSMKYINHSVWSDLLDASKSFSKRSPGIIMRKGGKYVYTLVPITNSPYPPPPLPPSYNPQSPSKTYTREFASPTHLEIQARYLLSKDLSLDVKKMIFIVRMIVNVRTLWLSLIQLRLRCFVATLSAVYNRRISNLHDPSGATRYVFLYFFFFSWKKRWYTKRK